MRHMTWEYKTLYFNKKNFFTSGIDTKLLDSKINDYAEKGWELDQLNPVGWLSMQAVILVFRRQQSANGKASRVV
ncbi:MAG: DUF4177 domain-containing protein [Gammaproteobacteria bacterium]